MVQLFTQRGKGNAVGRVCVAHSDDVRVLFMHRRMQDEAGRVNGVSALDDPAAVVGEDQVGNLDLREMHRHGIGPIQAPGFSESRTVRCPGEAVVKALQGRRAARSHQPLLAMLPFPGSIGIRVQHWKNQARLLGLTDRHALVASRYQGGVF